jgi:RNA-binding protein
MPAPELTGAERRALRAHGQTLPATLQIGHHGVTSAVRKELATALGRDQLVKVRAAEPDRKARQALFEELAANAEAALVGTVGRTALLYRPAADAD